MNPGVAFNAKGGFLGDADPDNDPLFDELLLMEPRETFDPCIIGVVRRFNDRFVLYSHSCVIEALVEPDDDSDQDPREAALEHFEFNIVGGWVGETTPGFLEDDE
jgi:hypothetical protein